MANCATMILAFEEMYKLVQETLGGIRDILIEQTQVVLVNRLKLIAQARIMIIAPTPRVVVESAGITRNWIFGLLSVKGS
jgi:hypothetical protein